MKYLITILILLLVACNDSNPVSSSSESSTETTSQTSKPKTLIIQKEDCMGTGISYRCENLFDTPPEVISCMEVYKENDKLEHSESVVVKYYYDTKVLQIFTNASTVYPDEFYCTYN